MTKYQWTDWITHVPGQQFVVGTYGLFEFIGSAPVRKGTKPYVPYQVEGQITAAQRNHPCWFMTDNDGSHCRVIRYKLRSEATETVSSSSPSKRARQPVEAVE